MELPPKRNKNTSALLLFITIVFFCRSGHSAINNPFQQISLSSNDLEPPWRPRDWHQCFCDARQLVTDCRCTVQAVDRFNNEQLRPLLRELVEHSYFRYYKVNLYKNCHFWPDDGRCSIRDCHVEACDDDERAGSEPLTCADEASLGAVDATIPARLDDDSQEKFCLPDDGPQCEYVDLTRNPERYTGYSGASAWRVWRAIYEENCFDDDAAKLRDDRLELRRRVDSLCTERRAFYRLLSGLHTSINVHLCANYRYPNEWRANVREFQRRFDAESTDGEGPDRLRNLYFSYLVELRALQKAAPLLRAAVINSGDAEQDQWLSDRIETLLRTVDQFESHYDESQLFQYDSERDLLDALRSHFRNISRIMDCVGCDKCRLWGKVQVHGMGAALQVLFAPTSTLRWHDVGALLNAVGRLSESIAHLAHFRRLIDEENDKATRRQPDAHDDQATKHTEL